MLFSSFPLSLLCFSAASLADSLLQADDEDAALSDQTDSTMSTSGSEVPFVSFVEV